MVKISPFAVGAVPVVKVIFIMFEFPNMVVMDGPVPAPVPNDMLADVIWFEDGPINSSERARPETARGIPGKSLFMPVMAVPALSQIIRPWFAVPPGVALFGVILKRSPSVLSMPIDVVIAPATWNWMNGSPAAVPPVAILKIEFAAVVALFAFVSSAIILLDTLPLIRRNVVAAPNAPVLRFRIPVPAPVPVVVPVNVARSVVPLKVKAASLPNVSISDYPEDSYLVVKQNAYAFTPGNWYTFKGTISSSKVIVTGFDLPANGNAVFPVVRRQFYNFTDDFTIDYGDNSVNFAAGLGLNGQIAYIRAYV